MKTFEELNLIPALQQALAEEEYVTPTPIQAQTIPPALEGRDILGCAQTGTGKTAAFALPILNRLGQHNRRAVSARPIALILAPTRELAIQIEESLSTYGRHLRLRQALVYGGVSQLKQVRSLKRGAHIVVATPGRLLDLINQGHLTLENLEMFVLDEADRMLDMGFLPDLKRIIRMLPERRQSLFFSATISPRISELTSELLRDPVDVKITPEVTTVEKIEQRVLHVERSGKLPLLRNILDGPNVDRVVVFTKTKRTADQLAEQLYERGVSATAIHGNKSQNARQRALLAFRNRKMTVLVATDVAARGIDVEGISHVINFDLPIEPECYVHRIGRTGRAGAEGIALSFCSTGDMGTLRAIERLIGEKIPVDPEHPAPAHHGSSRGSRPAGNGEGRKPGRPGQRPRRSGGYRKPGEDRENGQAGPRPARRPSQKPGQKPNRKPVGKRGPGQPKAGPVNASN